MKQTEYLKLKEKIEKDYREKLGALELVWEMAKDNNQVATGQKKLTSCVRDVLENHTGRFDLKDVLLWVSDIYLDAIKLPTLSNILKRMSNEGIIEIIQTGTGSRPTVYNKEEEKTIEITDEEIPF